MKLEIIKLQITGVVSHYVDKKWVKSERCHEGGYFRKVKRKYDVPRVGLVFHAKVDIDLRPGSFYTDGVNQFMATTTNEVVNLRNEVKVFSIPDKLECVSTAYAEKII